MRGSYPGVVEFCLETDIFAFLFVLCTQDLEFLWLERAFDVGRVCATG